MSTITTQLRNFNIFVFDNVIHILLEALISSKTRIKLLYKFFLNSNTIAYLRSLEEEFGESTNAIRLELNKFENAGFLVSHSEGNKKLFKANSNHPLFKDINSIVMKLVGLDHVIDHVLRHVGDLEKVYLVGKLSTGQDSDIIDLVLVGNINKSFLLDLVEKAEKKLNKKIRHVSYLSEEFEISKITEGGIKPLLLWSKYK